MIGRVTIAAVMLAVLCFPSVGQQPMPVKAAVPGERKANDARRIMAALHEPVNFDNLENTPLSEIKANLEKQCQVSIHVNLRAFSGEMRNILDLKANIGSNSIRGMRLDKFLEMTLRSMGATYLVRNDHIEITSFEAAARETGANLGDNGVMEDGQKSIRFTEPLICATFKEKPLNEAVAELADDYDLSVVIAPQSGDNRTAFVNAKLLNVPADKALELLALQADLRVVRKGKAFYITSRDQANDLFSEANDKERQTIELERLRDTPPAPPAVVVPAPVPPAPVPAPAPAPGPGK